MGSLENEVMHTEVRGVDAAVLENMGQLVIAEIEEIELPQVHSDQLTLEIYS